MIDPDKRYIVLEEMPEVNENMEEIRMSNYKLCLSYNELLKIINNMHDQMMKTENALEVNKLFAMHY